MIANEIIIVEQGRVNWKGDYLPITYAPVDMMKTARFLHKEILKDYRKKPNTKVTKISDDVYEARTKHPMLEDEVYFISIRRFTPSTIDQVKQALEMAKNKKPEPTCLVSYNLN